MARRRLGQKRRKARSPNAALHADDKFNTQSPDSEEDGEGPSLNLLSGWNAIQWNMNYNDMRMIGDMKEDIDTILVVSGLFSGVLVTFLIESYYTLWDSTDDRQLQLLSLIASQLGAPDEYLTSLQATAAQFFVDFSPLNSNIAINALWFASLILSIGSALFSLMVKQWCREYLLWYSVLSPARQNIILRQVRSEAWETYKVPAIIAAIPVLIEVSLVLFFLGLAIFCWQLPHVIKGVSIACIGLTLLIAIGFTLSPIASRLVPFKTPLGWAILRLAQLFVISRSSERDALGGEGVLQGWRKREAHIVEDPRAASSIQVSAAVKFIVDSRVGPLSTNRTLAPRDFRQVAETSLLVRALSWLRRGSDDEYIVEIIASSAEALHRDAWQSYHPRTVPSTRPEYFPAVHIVGQLCGWRDANAYSTLQERAREYAKCELLVKRYQCDQDPCSYHFAGRATEATYGPYVLPPENVEMRRDNAVSLLIARKVLFRELSWHIDYYTHCDSSTQRRSDLQEKIVTILCLLRCSPPLVADEDLLGEDINEWSAVLIDAFNSLANNSTAYYDGIAPMIFELLGFMGEISIDSDTHSLSVATALTFWKSWNGAANSAELAVKVFDATRNYEWADGRHLFVMAANMVFVRLQDRNNWSEVDDPHAVKEFLRCLRSALKISMRERYEYCGAYVQLPWLASLAQFHRAAFETHHANRDHLYIGHTFSIRHTPLARNDLFQDFQDFLFCLKEAFERGLFPDQGDQYRKLIGLIEEAVAAEEVALAAIGLAGPPSRGGSSLNQGHTSWRISNSTSTTVVSRLPKTQTASELTHTSSQAIRPPGTLFSQHTELAVGTSSDTHARFMLVPSSVSTSQGNQRTGQPAHGRLIGRKHAPEASAPEADPFSDAAYRNQEASVSPEHSRSVSSLSQTVTLLDSRTSPLQNPPPTPAGTPIIRVNAADSSLSLNADRSHALTTPYIASHFNPSGSTASLQSETGEDIPLLPRSSNFKEIGRSA